MELDGNWPEMLNYRHFASIIFDISRLVTATAADTAATQIFEPLFHVKSGQSLVGRA